MDHLVLLCVSFCKLVSQFLKLYRRIEWAHDTHFLAYAEWCDLDKQ